MEDHLEELAPLARPWCPRAPTPAESGVDGGSIARADDEPRGESPVAGSNSTDRALACLLHVSLVAPVSCNTLGPFSAATALKLKRRRMVLSVAPGAAPAPAAESDAPPDREEAARCIQRCARTHKQRKMWPSMEKLRALFMDKKAIEAGAMDNKWYKPMALGIREALRTAPEVVAALSDAWEAIHAACGRPPEGLSLDMYTKMCRKMYLVAKLEDGDGSIDPVDCIASVREDWADDAGGAEFLTEELFKRCWFQLADISNDNVGEEEYAEWIRSNVGLITEKDEDDPSSRCWRPDGDLLGASRAPRRHARANSLATARAAATIHASGSRARATCRVTERVRREAGMSVKVLRELGSSGKSLVEAKVSIELAAELLVCSTRAIYYIRE